MILKDSYWDSDALTQKSRAIQQAIDQNWDLRRQVKAPRGTFLIIAKVCPASHYWQFQQYYAATTGDSVRFFLETTAKEQWRLKQVQLLPKLRRLPERTAKESLKIRKDSSNFSSPLGTPPSLELLRELNQQLGTKAQNTAVQFGAQFAWKGKGTSRNWKRTWTPFQIDCENETGAVFHWDKRTDAWYWINPWFH